MSITPSPKIFKAYDVRGVYSVDLDETIAYKVGRCFTLLTSAKSVVVGRDMRLSSPQLQDAIIKGITDQGADVKNIGLVSTDMFYFACGSTGSPGIIVTASHNPPQYNGFKMVKQMPELLSGGNGMETLRDMVINWSPQDSSIKGSVSQVDVREDFRKKVLSLVETSKIRPMKVVVDPSNGTGGIAFDLAFRDLPVEVVRMCFEPDGTFPNHGGDPLIEENRRALQARVVKENADLGFAFDPDADRFFVIDREGRFVSGDFMTALLGRYFIEKNGGGSIVYDTRASWAVRDLVEGAGGTAIEMRIGHAYIKAKMQETNSIFGGEVTGHYYFRDFFLADSGIIPALVLLEMLGHYGMTLEQLLAPLQAKYFISGEINSKIADPGGVLRLIEETYRTTCQISKIDGITVIGDDWHGNVRASNTEPLVRLNVEGMSLGRMEEKRDEMLEIIRG